MDEVLYCFPLQGGSKSAYFIIRQLLSSPNKSFKDVIPAMAIVLVFAWLTDKLQVAPQ